MKNMGQISRLTGAKDDGKERGKVGTTLSLSAERFRMIQWFPDSVPALLFFFS